MADEQFLNSEQELQREQFRSRDNETPQMQQMMQGQTVNANGIPCPKCGTVNDPDATYCALCGAFLITGVCPNCGSEIDPDADFCEACHHYIKTDVCSFCGASFNERTASWRYCMSRLPYAQRFLFL